MDTGLRRYDVQFFDRFSCIGLGKRIAPVQRIEAFNGIAILATNKRENIDAAFLRRLPYIIDLP